MIKTISTTPYNDQKMGTAGLRKKSRVAMQPNYVENFMQSIFNTIGKLDDKTFLVGGDGRFYNDVAIQKIIKMAAANGVKKLVIGQNGFISTPAGSHVILKNKLDGGFVLSASHNPGGPDGDFGIKYSNQTGGQVPSSVTDKIYENTKSIREYKICDIADIDLSRLGRQNVCGMEIEIIDPVVDYVDMMQEIFDFPAIKKLFANGFTMCFDAMNAVTGPYAVRIFEELLGARKGSVVHARPLPDFGGLHPDPNLVYAKELVDLMFSDEAPDFGGANDGDGDRNMILGKKFFVTPSDSLAILTDNYNLIPAYKNGIYGVAKSAATSTAVSRVAKAHDIGYYEVPTGWKYFVNLMDSRRITFCGEESFGTGSAHIREKDGIWAILFWLNIIAATGKSVEEITVEHWKKYGRSYYMRFDFEGLDTAVQIMVQVDAYQTLNRPVIDTRWTRVITNYAMLYLRDLSNEADGYQFVTAKSQKDLKKGNYTAQTKIANSELNQYPELKYIPEGTHSLYCRAYKENSSHVMEYGEWSDGVPVTVKVKTPDAPVVQKVQVKKNDVRIVLNSKGEEPDGYDVVAARSKNGKEPSDYIKVKSGYSGSSKELILRGVPAGTWYIGVHAYKYLNGSNTKVLSKWAEVRKVTVKTSLVTGKPAVKSAKVSRQGTKRNVTVTFTVPKSCDGTDWVLAKKVSKSDNGSYTGVSSYAYTKKNQTKTTVVFKSVKPGVYYLAGRAYVKGYAKSYTKWSKIKKIVVK